MCIRDSHEGGPGALRGYRYTGHGRHRLDHLYDCLLYTSIRFTVELAASEVNPGLTGKNGREPVVLQGAVDLSLIHIYAVGAEGI